MTYRPFVEENIDDKIFCWQLLEQTNLTIREQNILNLRYGLDGRGGGLTYDQIGARIGVTNTRVIQIIEKSKRKIKTKAYSMGLMRDETVEIYGGSVAL